MMAARRILATLATLASVASVAACTHTTTGTAVESWRPHCSDFESLARTVCDADARADVWAFVGTFNGEQGCWQLTGEPGKGTIIECRDGYGLLTDYAAK